MGHDPSLAETKFDKVYAAIGSDQEANRWLDAARQVHNKDDLRDYTDRIYRELVLPNTSAQTAEQFRINVAKMFANWDIESKDWHHSGWTGLAAFVVFVLGIFTVVGGAAIWDD